jgi:hypothetical protein
VRSGFHPQCDSCFFFWSSAFIFSFLFFLFSIFVVVIFTLLFFKKVPLPEVELSKLWNDLPKLLGLKEAIKAVKNLNGRYRFHKPGVDNLRLLPFLAGASGKWVIEFDAHCVVYDADKQLVYECDASYPAFGIHVTPESLAALELFPRSISKCYGVTFVEKRPVRK